MGRLYSDKHISKQHAFRHICGGCGRLLKRNSKKMVGFLCRTCSPQYPLGSRAVACSNCKFEMDCTMRVQLGIWVRCEIPDIGDLERLQHDGGLQDEKVRAALDLSLVGSGSRQVLEEAVSQSTPKVYQNIAV